MKNALPVRLSIVPDAGLSASVSQESVLDFIDNADLLKEFFAHITQNPHLIPADVVIELLSGLVNEDANHGFTTLTSDVALYEQLHPQRTFMASAFVEAWALAHKKRLIDDHDISEAIRLNRNVVKDNERRGFLGRVFAAALNKDQKTHTQIIRDMEDLASHREALRLEVQQMLAEKATLAAHNAKFLEAASTEVVRFTKRTVDEANKSMMAAIEYVKSVEARTVELEKEHELLRQKYRAQEGVLRAEVSKLETMRQDLLQNPELAGAYARTQAESKAMFEELLVDLVVSLFCAKNPKPLYHAIFQTLVNAENTLERTLFRMVVLKVFKTVRSNRKEYDFNKNQEILINLLEILITSNKSLEVLALECGDLFGTVIRSCKGEC